MRFMPLAPEDEKLIEAAADVMHRNYHPVKRSVAAAVVCASGRIYTGIDIESCGYSLVLNRLPLAQRSPTESTTFLPSSASAPSAARTPRSP